MKSPTNFKCEVCNDTGYVSVKCLIEDYKRKCPSCYEEKKINKKPLKLFFKG